jgi:quercetin dioxygenase-like cupin family protein
MKIVRNAPASVPWSENFTGVAWMDLLLQEPLSSSDGHVLLTTVTFLPGVRTHWHRHDGGQILLVVAGQGWVATRDDGQQVLRMGDVVWAPPGEDHWHGATEATSLTHVAVTLGTTRWFEAVELLP